MNISTKFAVNERVFLPDASPVHTFIIGTIRVRVWGRYMLTEYARTNQRGQVCSRWYSERELEGVNNQCVNGEHISHSDGTSGPESP